MPDTDKSLGAPPSIQVEEQDPLIGLDLGGFKVTRLLAAGGMGLVYEAMHQTIGRRAAVKVLKPEVAADAEWTKRFLSEARALGSLKHRNLIEVMNFGKTPDGREFLMMEFLDGEPLDAYIRRLGQLAPAQALGIADQILNGLAEAHKKGVVHRDLKPSNVYLLREHNGELLVKVLDFGLARQESIAMLEGAVSLAKRTDGASLLAGTPEYIAPEQAQGLKVEGTADLYSLGVMLFEMLTGRLPFESDSVTELLQKHLSQRPPALSAVMNNVPEGVEEFVEALLSKEPAGRPSSADAARVTVQRLLRRLSQDSTAVRRAPDPVELVSKHAPTMKIDRPPHAGTDKALAAAFPEKKSRTGLIALVVLVLLLLGGIGLTFLGGPKPPPTPPVVADVQPPTPTPVPVPVQPVVDVAPPKPDLEEMVPLPKDLKKPEPAPAPVAVKKVFIESSGCQPTDDWKKRLQGNVEEMGEAVIKDEKKYSLWEKEGPSVVKQVLKAGSVTECATAQAAYDGLAKKLGL